ncbi:hypothetical protein ACFSUP_04315 [Gracilibacillus thailandensis]
MSRLDILTLAATASTATLVAERVLQAQLAAVEACRNCSMLGGLL